jgi:glycosyltransferase involved in cell wall biosynthesis
MKEGEGARSTQVIIAALNEEKGIGITISELKEVIESANILVVDGRSCDRTVEVAKNMGANIIYQSGTGKGDAIAAGLKCSDRNVDYIVFIDADYSYSAKYIPDMVKVLDENPQVGMVCGNRFTGHMNAKVLNNIFYFGNRVIAFTHNFLNGITLQDPLTGLRVVRAKILQNWNVKSKGFDIEVELNHHVERSGFDICEVPIEYRARIGEKKLKVSDGAVILKRIISETTY